MNNAQVTRRAVLPLVIAVTLAGLGCYAYLRRNAQQDEQVRRMQRQLQSVQAELSSLNQRDPRVIYVDRPEPAPGAPAVSITAKDSSSASDPGLDLDSTDDPGQHDTARRLARFSQALDRRLQAEGVDSEWGARSQWQIQSTLKEHAPGTTLVASTCGSTLCRVVVNHDSRATKKAFGLTVADQPPFDQGTHYLPGPSGHGALATTLYIVRAGHNVKSEADEARH